MEKLSLKIQGVKGGNPTWKEDTGYIAAFIGGNTNYILIDAFQGTGVNYKRRDQNIIRIFTGEKEFEFKNFDAFAKTLELGESHKTYNVVFNNSEISNDKGWKESVDYCKDYIEANNGTKNSYFADYKGEGTVSIVCNETEETVFETEVK